MEVNAYMYGYSSLINMMKRFTKQKDLNRSTLTRFATALLTLISTYRQKDKDVYLQKLDKFQMGKGAKG